ncbi:hypothetical protein [Cohnella xylanilytica]|uniref:hypothetical protein n=1 Tax=Cohnella xylanilytica TaxID=557555 RepID=UPI001BB416D7|nr:hypothetical protein [Cohnella xylanilytica]
MTNYYQNYIHSVITTNGDNKLIGISNVDGSLDNKIYFGNVNGYISANTEDIISIRIDGNEIATQTLEALFQQIEDKFNRGLIGKFNIEFLTSINESAVTINFWAE